METQSTDTLFAKALREDWNSEQDWLWLASKVEQDDQLVICLENALRLNPENENTQQQLRTLQSKSSSKDGTTKILRNLINSTKQFLF